MAKNQKKKMDLFGHTLRRTNDSIAKHTLSTSTTYWWIYVRLFANKAEKRNNAEERTHGQRQTDTVVHKTNLQYYPSN